MKNKMKNKMKVTFTIVTIVLFNALLAQNIAVYDKLQKIAAGEYQVNYIKNEDSTLWSAGDLYSGYLGTGGVVNPGMPIKTKQQSGLPMPKFIKTYGGLHQNAAIDVNGNVWTIGEASASGCTACIAGDGGGSNYSCATRIFTDDMGQPFTGIKMLAMFAGNGLGWYAVKGADSTLWWWGQSNGGGYSLNGTGGNVTQNKPTKITLPGNKKVVQIVCGNQVIVLCSDGTVYTGGGTCDPYQSPKGYNCTGNMYYNLNQVAGLVNVTSIAGGFQFAYAVCGTDSVMAWGRTNLLGVGATGIGPQITPIKVNWNLPSPVKMIVTNRSSSHAILVDSTLWGWGWSGQGEVGDSTMMDKNIYNFNGGIAGDTIIAAPKRIVPTRSDFVNIYGATPYTFFSYFEAVNGQMYFCGRNKSGVGATGEVAPSGTNMAADYNQTWSQPKAIPVDIFSLRSKISVPAQQCVTNPNATGCFNYVNPPFLAPSITATPNKTITTTVTTITAAATPQTGRKISSYIWDQIAGPSYAYFNTFNDSIAVVSRLQVGTYKFRVKATDMLNSYNTATVTIVVGLTTSINNNFNISETTLLFPNPTNNLLNIQTDINFSKYEIFNISGKLVLNGDYTSVLKVKDLSDGIYFLILSDTDSNKKQMKFIKCSDN